MAQQADSMQTMKSKVEKQMAVVRRDYNYMSGVITKLHKEYGKTKEVSNQGFYIISGANFERWAAAKAKELGMDIVYMYSAFSQPNHLSFDCIIF